LEIFILGEFFPFAFEESLINYCIFFDSDGDEKTRKAMNKSFQESGGTVLSTNWDEIQKDKVEVKPPDGMEFKKWD
jgi:hypothetical protein